MELQILPKYVDTILIDNMSKKNRDAIKRAGLTFDDDECELTMEFYDGVAYDVNGTGLVLRYPTMAEIHKSKVMQNKICDYIGIYDGTINQHDVALTYGIISKSDDEDDKTVHTTRHNQCLRDETMILLAADMFQFIYNLSDDYMDYSRVVRIIRTLGEQFEAELDWQGDDNEERDYIEELEAFEERAKKILEREVDINKKWD